jgi:hypothetical protein
LAVGATVATVGDDIGRRLRFIDEVPPIPAPRPPIVEIPAVVPSAVARVREVADQLPSASAAIGAQIADNHAARARPEWRRALSDVTGTASKEAACSLVSEQMTPDERDSQGIDVVDVLVDAVIATAIDRLSGWPEVQALDWTTWGEDVVAEAGDLVAAAGDLEPIVNGHTQAYWYYLRICHSPPTG